MDCASIEVCNISDNSPRTIDFWSYYGYQAKSCIETQGSGAKVFKLKLYLNILYVFSFFRGFGVLGFPSFLFSLYIL